MCVWMYSQGHHLFLFFKIPSPLLRNPIAHVTAILPLQDTERENYSSGIQCTILLPLCRFWRLDGCGSLLVSPFSFKQSMRWSIALRRLQVAGQYSSGAWGGLPQHLQLRNADGQEGDLQITNKRQQVRIAWFSFILSGFLINVVHSPHSLVRLVVVLNTKKNVESYILSLCDSEFWETTSELLKVLTKTLVIDFVRSFLSPLAVSRVSLVFSLNFCNICDIICPETMLSMPMTVCLVCEDKLKRSLKSLNFWDEN